MSTPEQPAAEPAESAQPAETGEPAAQTSESAAEPVDDVRAKFRDALAAKQAGQPHLGGAPRTGPGQAHTAAARPTRRFRRKSG